MGGIPEIVECVADEMLELGEFSVKLFGSVYGASTCAYGNVAIIEIGSRLWATR